MKTIRATLLLVGLAGMGYAVIGIRTDGGTSPVHQALFMVALIVAHDAIVLPLAIGVGVLLVRFVPGWARPSAQLGLYASAVLSLFAFPLIASTGRLPDNASILPLNYVRGLGIVLAVIWLVAGVWATLRWRRMRLRRVIPVTAEAP